MVATAVVAGATADRDPHAPERERGHRKSQSAGSSRSAPTLGVPAFSAVKVFSCTMYRDRDELGERVTEWLRAHKELRPVEAVVTQSSDQEYHCLTITLFLAGDADAFLAEAASRPPARAAVTPGPRRSP